MCRTIIRKSHGAELDQVSAQLAASYKQAYRGMMSDAYLDGMGADHWVPILTESLARGDLCLIAEQDGVVVGTAVFGDWNGDKQAGYCHAIYLSFDHIGLGLGHQLYCAMEQAMRERGYKTSALELLTDNRRALAFYLAHGYRVEDTFWVEENGMCLHCHTMSKELG